MLTNLLRGAGYYDAQVTTRIEPGNEPTVLLTAVPGNLYRFAGVTLDGVKAAGDKAAPLERRSGFAQAIRSMPTPSSRARRG